MKVGLPELLVVFIVALFVVGPDKMPYYAKKLGEALGEFRKFSNDATKEIRESIAEPLEEAQRPLREAMEPVQDLEKAVHGDIREIKKTLSDIGKEKPVKIKAEEKDQTETEEKTESNKMIPDTEEPEESTDPEAEKNLETEEKII